MTLEEAKRIAYTLLRVFFGAVVGYILANALDILDLSWSNYQPAILAGITAVLVAAFNFLNPGDTRYGIGYEPEQ